MAYEDEINSKNYNDFTFEKLYDTFHKLIGDFKRLSFKNKELRKLNHSLLE